MLTSKLLSLLPKKKRLWSDNPQEKIKILNQNKNLKVNPEILSFNHSNQDSLSSNNSNQANNNSKGQFNVFYLDIYFS